MQAWAKHSQAKSDFPPETVVAKLRNFKPLAPPLIVDFTMHPDANPPSRRIKLVRFADNKGKNWGPKSRAKRRKVDAGSNDDSGEGNKQSGVTEVGD
jgi:tRNA (guanine26-N2/guanine27-N2)-dimethyltransferase